MSNLGLVGGLPVQSVLLTLDASISAIDAATMAGILTSASPATNA